jgi:hypothetical protein
MRIAVSEVARTVERSYAFFRCSENARPGVWRAHPYHGTTGNRCAERRFPRSSPTVGAEVIGSPLVKLCALFTVSSGRQGAYEFPARAHAQLGIGVGEVGLHRALANVEPLADRLGGQALNRQSRYLEDPNALWGRAPAKCGLVWLAMIERVSRVDIEQAWPPAIMWVSNPMTRPDRRARLLIIAHPGGRPCGRACRAGRRPVLQPARRPCPTLRSSTATRPPACAGRGAGRSGLRGAGRR